MTAELLTATSTAIPSNNGGYIDLGELRDRFYDSDIAHGMNKQTPRYASRFPEEHYSRIPELLGDDSLPLEHQMELAERHLTATLAAEIGKKYEISPEDQALLYFTAFFHDVGESEHQSITDAGLTVVGDIMSGKKTDQNRRDEANVRSFIFHKFFSDVDDTFLTRAEALIMHAPITGDELVHELYEAAHELQVSDTVKKARESLELHKDNPILRPILERLVEEVHENNTEKLGHFTYLTAVRDELANYGISPTDADE